MMSTKATLLMEVLNQEGNVLVKVVDLPARNDPLGSELHHFGHSLCEESTYLDSGMVARVSRAFVGPVLPPLPDTPDYVFYQSGPAYKPGWVYLVFDHSEFVEENEKVAARNWYNTVDGKYLTGTAREVGCYTGFDVIGFPPAYDLTRVFEIINCSA